MVILIDVGNTHTHLGCADAEGIVRREDFPTKNWFKRGGDRHFLKLFGSERPSGAAFCSVVPRATPRVVRLMRRLECPLLEVNARTVSGVGVNYPNPETVGPDRLANSVAVRHHFGAPAVVVDFGTAVTFDVVDRHGDYVGGVIAPGLAVMTDYLHEKTALLPKIEIREITGVIGKSTEQAMLIGAVHGYRGMVREIVARLKRQLRARRLPVVATGGYAELVASKLPEITAVEPDLTLEGLRLEWEARYQSKRHGLRGQTH